MGSAYPLSGRSILVVEDEPLIALEIAGLFESAGAKVQKTNQLVEALGLVEQGTWAAAILDYRLGDHDVGRLCQCLADRRIPFMFYTGLSDLADIYGEAVVVQKPASSEILLKGMSELVLRHEQGSLVQVTT